MERQTDRQTKTNMSNVTHHCLNAVMLRLRIYGLMDNVIVTCLSIDEGLSRTQWCH